MAMLADLHQLLKKRGIRLVLAGRKRQMLGWFEQAGIPSGEGGILIRPDLYLALKMNQSYKQALAEGQAPVIKKAPEDDVLLHSHL